jgi:hypothetical protein
MLRDSVPCLMRFEVEDEIFRDQDTMIENEDEVGAGEIAPTRRLMSLSRHCGRTFGKRGGRQRVGGI